MFISKDDGARREIVVTFRKTDADTMVAVCHYVSQCAAMSRRLYRTARRKGFVKKNEQKV